MISNSDRHAILLKQINEFELLVSEEKRRLGRKYRKIKFIREFCDSKNIKWKTFYAHLLDYEKNGKLSLFRMGVKPAKEDTFLSTIPPLLQKITLYGKSYAVIHREVVSACERKAITPPSYHSTARIIKMLFPAGGKALSVVRREQNYIATLIIDRNKPLEAVKQLAEFLQSIADGIPSFKAIENLLSDCLYFSKAAGIKKMKPIVLLPPLDPEEIKTLHGYQNSTSKITRNRAVCFLMANENKTLLDIMIATKAKRSTVHGWLTRFKKERLSFIELKRDRKKHNLELRERKNRIVEILHQSPHEFDINRTTWILADIAKVYQQQYDHSLSTSSVRRAIKEANYTWRRARRVLTSNDPEFKEKAQAVLDVLRNLKENEVFFFLDEAGPWRVKKYGGTSLTAPGKTKKYPEFQPRKGHVIFIGALNAIDNQVIWFFVDSKNSASVNSMLTAIYYSNLCRSTIYVTWDCASWHSSKELSDHIDKLTVDNTTGPELKILPLPKKAQYLNVIESVFSGLKKAVIHNSDYKNVYEMQKAISEHFYTRNEYFWENPKKVGHKIWDAELFNLENFSGGLHKHV